MVLIGRLHPLLIHFPIAFVLAAAAAEVAGIVTGSDRWRAAAVANLVMAAAVAPLAAIAGWRLAADSGFDAARLIAWHRWLAVTGTVVTVVAAFAATWPRSSPRWAYRSALFAGALLIGIASHIGGLMVWGADFLSW